MGTDLELFLGVRKDNVTASRYGIATSWVYWWSPYLSQLAHQAL
jgi:hypothetical protein